MVFAWIPTVPNVDLSGKTALVTGGNAGIGFEVSKKLYELGASVSIASRNVEKSKQAIEKLKSSANPVFPGGSLEAYPLDLGNQDSIKTFAKTWSRAHDSLNILVNNAGFLDIHGGRGDDGLFKTIRVNHHGPFLLSHLLTEPLRKGFRASGEHSRAVYLSSSAHYHPGEFDVDDIDAKNTADTNGSLYPNMKLYGISKQMNLMTARVFDKKEHNNGIVSLSVHPGVVETEFLSSASMLQSLFMTPLIKLFARNPREGAATALFASVDPTVVSDSKYWGAYLDEQGRVAQPCKQAQDMKECEKLWANTASALGI
ncbi:MAG: hypothetical protein SGCHY_003536 [Lobulomycetales sp.]